jgi:hypothetical protein
MTLRKQASHRSISDEQREAILERALAQPGVADVMEVYESAESVYASTIREPRVWYATSTSQADPANADMG